MIGKNSGDRQKIKSTSREQKISSMLKEGGEFKFYVKCGNPYSWSYYNFTISSKKEY